MNILNKLFKNEKVSSEVQRILAVLIFTTIYGIGMAWFIDIHFEQIAGQEVRLYTGGIPGILQVVSDFFNNIIGDGNFTLGRTFISIGSIILNIPVLILGWFGVSHRFTIYSLMSILIQSTILGLVPIVNMGLTSDPLASSVIGGMLIGVGVGGALKFGTSTGGFDIIAQYYSLKKGKSVGAISLMLNLSIALLGGIILKSPIIVSYTIIRIIITTIVVDRFHTSYQYVAFNIITTNPNDIVSDLLSNLYRGVTLINVEGAYSNLEKKMIYIVISSFERSKLIKACKKADPICFIVETPAKNVYGNFSKKTIA